MQARGGYLAAEKTSNDRGISRRMKFLFRIVGGLLLQLAKVAEQGRWNGMKMLPKGEEAVQVDAYFVVVVLVSDASFHIGKRLLEKSINERFWRLLDK